MCKIISGFEFNKPSEKTLLVLLDKVIYFRFGLNNDQPFVSYDYELLKDMLAALDLDTQNYLTLSLYQIDTVENGKITGQRILRGAPLDNQGGLGLFPPEHAIFFSKI